MAKLHWFLLLLILSGCATIGLIELDKQYGSAAIENRNIAKIESTQHQQYFSNHFINKVQPIIENRCVVCHGCFDAPCQLKMESRLGIERGANKKKIYNGERLITMTPTDNLDSYNHYNQATMKAFRQNGFFPILNERQQTPQANTDASVFYQMLALKKQHPLPKTTLLDERFDLSLDRNQQCPTIEEFDRYKRNYPLGGMPYGLPELSTQEHNTLTTWLKNGAVMPAYKAITSSEQAMVNQWELFLNGNSNKEQLMSRYLFEHLYLADLFFDANTQHYFNVVRSSTPTGTAIKAINTRRPYSDPYEHIAANKKPRVYYRIQKNNNTIIAKRHMPYRFDLAKLARYKALFITPNYQVNSLPSYQLELASNPFKTFKDLPAKSRYLFLLDEAQYSIMNFIKGPVCRGQIALNVIDDHFWVFFENPDNISDYHTDNFIVEKSDLLQLPASSSNNIISLLDWRKYANRQQAYLTSKLEFLDSIGFRQTDLDLNLVWSGQGNPNAVLTVFRHFDSASVLKGFVGQPPKSAWLVSYPLLERIHYLLVAGFDVYGTVGHQLKTRLYMDFLRMEAESHFIALLPKKDRRTIHEYWYRDTSDTIKDYIFSDDFKQLPESNIHYKSKQPQQELYQLLAKHTEKSVTNNYQLTINSTDNNTNNSDYKIARLHNMKGEAISILPQVSYVMVTGKTKSYVYTLINNSAHSNVAHLFSESNRRIIAEDTLTVTAGIVGTYPNAFFEVTAEQLGEFVAAFENIHSEQDYSQLKDKYGVRRTSKNFWPFADKLHTWYKKNQPNDAGLLDFNRLENR